MQIEMDRLRGFKKYGLIVKGKNSTQGYGDCPFCGKENKFYVNLSTLLWDCKSCQFKGNYLGYLEYINKQNQSAIQITDYTKLAQNRGIPIDAFKNWGFGKHDKEYTLPIWNDKGKLQDIRSYILGKKFMSSPDCRVGLLGMEKLVNTLSHIPVYICEGEWDCIAMDWLIKLIGKKGVVVGSPGANTFKQEWCFAFRGRDINVLYDNDLAGENGDQIIKGRLNGCAKSIKFIHWFLTFKKGYDIRDFIKTEAVNNKRPRRCFNFIEKMLGFEPRNGSIPISIISRTDLISEETKIKSIKIDPTITLDKVYKVFEKWMYMPNRDAIEVSIACVISNGLQGDPIWMFLVAPPGGSKTEILSTFDKCFNVYITSSLTSHSLISGASFKNGQDLSLIPQLNGKTLVIKDFTSILGKRENEKDEIFGILRDAYDGKCGKVFGTGLHRYYSSHFSILGGVTPPIYELSSQYAGLGERFLKFFIGDNLVHTGEENIILRSMRNVNKELSMREEMAEIVKDYVILLSEYMKRDNFKLPIVSEEIEKKIVACAQFVARMRAIVLRDKYNSEMILSKPSAEVGSRIGKQLIRLALSLAITNQREKVTEHDIRIVKKAALDTISQRNEDILRILYKSCPTLDDTLDTKNTAFRSRYPVSTVNRVLNDMYVLDIVKKVGVANKVKWTVSEYLRDLILKSTFYSTEEELNRPLRSIIKRIKIKKHKSKDKK